MILFSDIHLELLNSIFFDEFGLSDEGTSVVKEKLPIFLSPASVRSI